MRVQQVGEFVVGCLGLVLSGSGLAHAAPAFVPLGFLDANACCHGSRALAVSADGSTVVGGSGGEPFRWTSGGGMVGLGFLPGRPDFIEANGVSADGSTVVGGGAGSNWFLSEAFRWTSGGGMVGLGYLPGNHESRAYAISADGSTIVGDGGDEAFRWTSGGGMVGLGFLPGDNYSVAYGVSADGSTVVGSSGDDAFVWDSANGMRDLDQVLTALGADLTGWTSMTATGISADGRIIVGYGYNPTGPEGPEAWVATIPEPTTAVLLAVGLGSIATLRRRHPRVGARTRS